jgi:hypothetical protein
LAILRRLRKPDFESWCAGGFLSPDILDMELKRRLWDHLPTRWPWAAKADVLYLIGEGVQSAQMFFEGTVLGGKVAELEGVQEQARSLLKALAKLSPDTVGTLDSHTAYLMLGKDAPERLSEFTESARRERELISRWWDVVQDVETAAGYAATQQAPSKAQRPSIRNAKRLVYHAADAVYCVRGALPPRGKGTWFPEFARELGSGLELTCGLALVDSVVRKMGSDGRHPEKAPESLAPYQRMGFVPPMPSPD